MDNNRYMANKKEERNEKKKKLLATKSVQLKKAFRELDKEVKSKTRTDKKAYMERLEEKAETGRQTKLLERTLPEGA